MPATRIAVLAALAACFSLTGPSNLITGQWGGPSFRLTAYHDSTVVRSVCSTFIVPGLIAVEHDGIFHATGKRVANFSNGFGGGIPLHLSGQLDPASNVMTVIYYSGVPSTVPPNSITVQAVSGSSGDFSGYICGD